MIKISAMAHGIVFSCAVFVDVRLASKISVGTLSWLVAKKIRNSPLCPASAPIYW
jgi:hypothetical protein